MDIAVKENNKNNDWYIETQDPTLYEAFKFTPCTPTKGESCYSIFVYGDSPAEVTLGNKLAEMLDIGKEDVGWKFVNKSDYPDLKDYLFANLNSSRIGVEFLWPNGPAKYTNGDAANVLPASYTLHYNQTRNCGDLGVFNCENTEKEKSCEGFIAGLQDRPHVI